MRKNAILFLCMAAGLMSCAKEVLNPENENVPGEGVPMTFNLSVADTETKAAKTGWENGDKIYVFFNGLETKYLIMEYDGSAWSETSGGGTLTDTDFSALGNKTLTAVHFPVAVDVSYADSKFSFTRSGKPVYNYYLFETDKAYTVDGTTVTATLALGKPANMVQIHVAGIQGDVDAYRLGCTKIKPVACASVGTDGAITESVLHAGSSLKAIADADGGIFAGRLTKAGVATDYEFTIFYGAKYYTLTRTDKVLTAGKMYNFPSLSTTGGSNWKVQNASDLVVDLGVVVDGKKVLWAKYNLGAATETGSGNYYSWGETTGYDEGKSVFYWNGDYKWGAWNSLTKYCNNSSYGRSGFTDALTTLELEDDAAHAALGENFRMPTDDEFKALIALPTNHVLNYAGTDVNGRTFTGNGNTIFLPNSGEWGSVTHLVPDTHGWYWTSSLYTSNPNLARCLLFVTNTIEMYYGERSYGFTIRPVYVVDE